MAWKPDYQTAAQLAHQLRIDDAVDDVGLALAVTSASRAIDLHTNRQYGLTTAEARFYTARYDRRRCRWVVQIDDLMDDTGADPDVVDADGVVVGAIDGYVLEPRNAAAEGRPWTQLVVKPTSAQIPTGADYEVSMTRPWGWTAVPTTIEQATLLQANRFFTRRNAPFGVAGSPDQGSEMRLLARVDPDVAVTIAPYIRWWAAA